jgi:sulfoxide reductase heme-binding subunit YedZ
VSKAQPLRVAYSASGILVAYIVVLLASAGYTEASTRAIVRITAEFGVLLFCSAFMATPLQTLARGRIGSWLLVNRRALGISFGIAHTLHLLALLALARSFPDPFLAELNVITLVAGGISSALIILMALTSSDAAQRAIGMKNWRRLHTVGSYLAWGVFTQSYLPRATQSTFYVPFSLLLIGTFLLRLLRIAKRRASVSNTRRRRGPAAV